MNFFRLSSKHKRKFILGKSVIILMILVLSYVALKIEKVTFTNNLAKVSGGLSFVTIVFIAILALFNRISTLFKIRSIGFVVLFFLLIGIEYIVAPARLITGLLLIPLMIDDFILTPIWKNIWYNDYADMVVISSE